MNIQELYDDFARYVEAMSADDVSQSLLDAVNHSRNSDFYETADERRALYQVYSSSQQASLFAKRTGYMYSSAIHSVSGTLRSWDTSKGEVA